MMPADVSPALLLWRRELRAGARSRLQLDVLWRAACWEVEADEAEADGRPAWSASCRRQAAAFVLRSARLKARGRCP